MTFLDDNNNYRKIDTVPVSFEVSLTAPTIGRRVRKPAAYQVPFRGSFAKKDLWCNQQHLREDATVGT